MIYLREGDKAKNVEELLRILFSANGLYGLVKTYFDYECTQVQSDGRYRSLTDMCEMCRTYFPNTTDEEVAYTLLNKFTIKAWYCTKVNRIVFYSSKQYPKSFYSPTVCRNAEDILNGFSPDFVDEMGLSYNIITQLAENYKP